MREGIQASEWVFMKVESITNTQVAKEIREIFMKTQIREGTANHGLSMTKE